MAFEYYELKQIDTLPSSPTVMVTNGGSEVVYVRLIILHNTDSSNRNVKLWTVPNGSSAVDATKWYDDNMAPGETLEFNFGAPGSPGIILPTSGDSLYAQADSAGLVTIQIYGGKDI